MLAMKSFHVEKCCHVVSAHAAYAPGVAFSAAASTGCPLAILTTVPDP